ncbi:MAG: oligosaccharide flippase family protein [Deltaproteobacteria bacterium]
MDPSSSKPASDAFLSTAHLSRNLRRRSVRGGVATLIGQGGTFAINLGGTAVLARMLSPRDFGLLAMVATFTRLIEQLKDMGLASATVSKQELSPAQVNYLFWINAALGGAAALAALLAAPAIAWFYGEPVLTGIACALGSGFFVAGLGVQHQALLQRQMRLSSLAMNKLVAAAVGTLAAVAAALWGAGYWSLVLMNVVTALAAAIGLWVVCGWRPSAPRRNVEGVQSLLAFGWHITGTRSLTFLTRNLDNILVGKVWGDVALGYYAKAYQILMLPVQQLINPLTTVVVPALSRLQHDQVAYIRYYQRSLRTLTTVTMPVVAVCFVASRELILVVLGARWEPCVGIFQWLAPAAFVGTFNPIAWAWVSLNQTDRMLRWTLIATPFYVAGFALGVPFGAEGVAAAFSLTQLALRYFSINYCFRANFLSFRILFEATWQATAASLGAALPVLALSWLGVFSGLPLIVALLLKGVLYALVYFGLWWCLPGGRRALRETLSLWRDLRPAAAKSEPKSAEPGATVA